MYLQYNKSLLEYNKVVQEKIESICSVLFKITPLTTFGYRRFYNEGHYIALSNNLKWQEHYFEHVKGPGNIFGDAIKNSTENSFTYLYWPTDPKEEIFQALYDFNIWHGLTIYRRKKEYVECFAFATTRDYSETRNLYSAHNLKIFKNFINYFYEQAHEIITTINEKKIWGKFNESNIIISTSQKEEFKEFLHHINIKRFPFSYKDKTIFLTHREYEILTLLSLGKTMAEVAAYLTLSARTIEAHMENLKVKFGVNSKAEILQVFYKNKHLWL